MNFKEDFEGNDELALTVRDAARYRAILQLKCNELARAAEGADSPAPAADDRSGDIIDWSRAETEADLQIQRRESVGALLRAIQEALARIRTGTFGKCEVCKRAIARARLEAIPWTRVCLTCKEASALQTIDAW